MYNAFNGYKTIIIINDINIYKKHKIHTMCLKYIIHSMFKKLSKL